MPLLKHGKLSSENELLRRCEQVCGLSFAQLALLTGLTIPSNPLQRKGWVGTALELALGATAGNKAAPDFSELAIELKTIPLGQDGKPAESTFVTSIPLLTIHQETWAESQCYRKLKRVLWLPVEGDKAIPFAARRIGQAVLWSPSKVQERVLAADWQELTEMIVMGQLEEIHAGIGNYLQIRPKAANGKSLCEGFNAQGRKIKTLPRGFYLRSNFTHEILKRL